MFGNGAGKTKGMGAPWEHRWQKAGKDAHRLIGGQGKGPGKTSLMVSSWSLGLGQQGFYFRFRNLVGKCSD